MACAVLSMLSGGHSRGEINSGWQWLGRELEASIETHINNSFVHSLMSPPVLGLFDASCDSLNELIERFEDSEECPGHYRR